MRPCRLLPVYCSNRGFRALPFAAMALQLAMCSGDPICGAVVQKVPDGNEGQHDSYHRTPSFRLSLDIDSRIAAQVFIGVFALEIGFARIHMPFVFVIKVILNSFIGHGITSQVCIWCFLVVSFV